MKLQNDQTLIGACSIYGNPIRTYDDGWGEDEIYLYQSAEGDRGLVRAGSLDDAYECVLDEILQPIPEEEIIEAYGVYVRGQKNAWRVKFDDGSELFSTYPFEKAAHQAALDWISLHQSDLVEGYQYQANASGSGIVRTSPYGEDLRPASQDNLRALGIIPLLETDD